MSSGVVRRASVYALILLLVLAGTAVAASPGDPLRLGLGNVINAATSWTGTVASRLVLIQNRSTEASARALQLVSAGAASTLHVSNTGTGPGLQIQVTAGKAPILVNSSAGKAVNLNADRLDGLDSGQFQRPLAGSCVPGTFLTEILQDGSAACNPDRIDGGDAATLDGLEPAEVDCMLGEVKLFAGQAGDTAPAGTLFAVGQLLPIANWPELYELLGTSYGGDGESNFALPNLTGLGPAQPDAEPTDPKPRYVICVQGRSPTP